MKKYVKYVLIVLGAVLGLGGLYYLKMYAMSSGVMVPFPYICIGVGCGIFGHGMGEVIGERTLKKHPELQKQMKIQENDERNIAIANRANGRAFSAMIYIFGALICCFGLMNVPVSAVLMLVCAYLFVVGLSVYYRFKYEKEM